jgi:hypothetical protein
VDADWVVVVEPGDERGQALAVGAFGAVEPAQEGEILEVPVGPEGVTGGGFPQVAGVASAIHLGQGHAAACSTGNLPT